jgi:uncharacterized protein (DUF1697 family)
VVEGGGLENRFPVLRNGGSNPSPSATIALLRGVNIGGHKKIPMAALKRAFEAMGFQDVRTVLASGNVIFETSSKDPRLGLAISRGLEKTFGFPVQAILRTVRELRAIVDSDPFRSVPSAPVVKPCVTFLPEKKPGRSRVRLPAPGPGFRVLRVTPGEVFSVVTLSEDGRTPDLMAFLERAFGKGITTRTWPTVIKLAGGRT